MSWTTTPSSSRRVQTGPWTSGSFCDGEATSLVIEDGAVLAGTLAVIAANADIGKPGSEESTEVEQLRVVHLLAGQQDSKGLPRTWKPTMSSSPVDKSASTSLLRRTAHGCSR